MKDFAIWCKLIHLKGKCCAITSLITLFSDWLLWNGLVLCRDWVIVSILCLNCRKKENYRPWACVDSKNWKNYESGLDLNPITTPTHLLRIITCEISKSRVQNYPEHFHGWHQVKILEFFHDLRRFLRFFDKLYGQSNLLNSTN